LVVTCLVVLLSCCPGCRKLINNDDMGRDSCIECDARFDWNQRRYAQENPGLYSQTVHALRGESGLVIKFAEHREVSGRILEVVGPWAITENGIECLITSYSIDSRQLDESDWVSQVSAKTWVNPNEFKLAYEKARTIHCYS